MAHGAVRAARALARRAQRPRGRPRAEKVSGPGGGGGGSGGSGGSGVNGLFRPGPATRIFQGSPRKSARGEMRQQFRFRFSSGGVKGMRFRALPARAGGDAGPVRAASAPSLARPSECDVRQEPPQSSDEPSTSGSGCLGVIPRRGSAGWARGSRPGGGAQRRAPGLGLGGARPEEPGGGQGAPLLPATCPLMWHFFLKARK